MSTEARPEALLLLFTRIDDEMFQTTLYFVESLAKDQRRLLCHWVENFYENGNKVQVFADSTMAAQRLDQLLWTFSQASFIPHRILTQSTEDPIPDPVIITIGEILVPSFGILICDATVHPDFMKHYDIVVMFVLRDDEDRLQESRLLWQSAKEENFILHHLPFASSRIVPSVKIK